MVEAPHQTTEPSVHGHGGSGALQVMEVLLPALKVALALALSACFVAHVWGQVVACILFLKKNLFCVCTCVRFRLTNTWPCAR